MARGDWECIACHVKNAPAVEVCEKCGVARPAARPRRTEGKPVACSIDGGTIDAKGFCSVGLAYVSAASCPFACPFCRRPLTWDGQCFSCYGAHSGERADWTIPGNRYVTDGGHYRLVEQGPLIPCTIAQNHEALKVVMAVASGELTEPAGHELLALLGIAR